VLPQN